MHRLLSSLRFCAACFGLLFLAVTAHAKIKVLVLTGGHPYDPAALYQLFKDDPEIEFTAVKHATPPDGTAEAYDRPDLYSFDAVVLYDSPLKITPPQQARFLGLFDRGIGVVVLHHAYLSYPLWSEYERIAGGKYVFMTEQMVNGITSSNYTREMVDIPVTVVAKHHPIIAGVDDFVIRDERYFNLHMLGNAEPLLKSGDEWLAWDRQEKKSRVFGMILGHGPTAYGNPNFRRILWQAIHWVARDAAPTSATP
jgi:type 1 glutamine amidotransferase